MSTSRLVFTALLGGYESLIEQPVRTGSDVDFICFTDDAGLKSDTWEIRLIDPLLPLDMFRSQRAIKIRGLPEVRAYDETLYIDNSVLLREDPGSILDRWLSASDVAISRHSFREKVIDEFDEVLSLGYDDASRVNEQLLYYAEVYPDVLEEHPHWNGMIARRNSPEVELAMNLWFDHVLRFSRRDQLSANVAFAIAGLEVAAIAEDNRDSESHQWPADVRRNPELTKRGRRHLGPPIAEIARLHREIAELHVVAQTSVDAAAASQVASAASAEELARCAERLVQVENEHGNVRRELEQAHTLYLSTAQELDLMRRSRVWRAATALRRLRGSTRH